MFLSNASIKRPIAMSCLIIAFILLGINSYRKFPLEFLPKMDTPYVTIVTLYPGASPKEIETDIAKKIEDAVSSIDGLKHVTSVCAENLCNNLLEFEMSVDVDIAAMDVREKLDLILNDLPSDAEKPKILKFDVNATPIIDLALKGEMNLVDLYDYADNELKDKLSGVIGVAEVELLGGSQKELHIILNKQKLTSKGLSSLDIVASIQNGIGIIPSGRVQDDVMEYNVKFDADAKSMTDFGNILVKSNNQERVYLKDIASIQFSSEERRQATFIDGEAAIGIKITKKSDANAVQVVSRIKKKVKEIQKSLPGGMNLIWIQDNGDFIESSATATVDNIWQGILLTALILILFLHNIQSTIIVSITMPISIIISLFFLYMMDYSLNTSTLLALCLSVGILVTNSIVVLESIFTLFKKEKNPKKAAGIGTAKVTVAVLASAGTNIVVLFPIAMMDSMIGKFFAPFALTMVIVTIVSLFISFTLTPILSSILLRPRKRGEKFNLIEQLEKNWQKMMHHLSHNYMQVIRYAAKHTILSIAILAGTFIFFIFSMGLGSKIGLSFFNESDKGSAVIKLEFPTYYNLERTTKKVMEAEQILKTLPHLEHLYSTIGKVQGVIGQSSEGVYLAQIQLKFNDKTERPQSLEELLSIVRKKLTYFTDAMVSANISSAIGGASKPVEMDIKGEDLKVLDNLAEQILDISNNIEGIRDPENSVRSGKPEILLTPKRTNLADFNIPVQGFGLSLRGTLEGLKSGTFKQGIRTYDIRVKQEKEKGKEQIKNLSFPGIDGKTVNIRSFTNIKNNFAPIQITRKDKVRISKFYANLGEGQALGTVINKLDKKITENISFPPGYDYHFAGDYEMMQESNESFAEAGLTAIIITYLVLAAILESFMQPVLIMITLPFGLIGMLWSLYVTGESMSMFVILGGVMLIGIVVNNAILIMSSFNQHQKEGKNILDSMLQACEEQFQPIIMITIAAILGMMPLAVSQGIGNEMRTGIGISSVGGILISSILTIFIVPVLYLFVVKIKTMISSKKEIINQEK